MEFSAGTLKCTELGVFGTRRHYCDGFYSIVTFVSTLYELPFPTLQCIWFVKKRSYSKSTLLSDAVVNEKPKHIIVF